MKITYEATVEINDTMAVHMAIDGINAVVEQATKKIENAGVPIVVPKEFYKCILVRVARCYGINIASFSD